MSQQVKLVILFVAKYLGLFTLARIVTRKGLRILCYHGFSDGDEHDFKPKLFMRPETFRTRMELLRRIGFPVMKLGAAVEGLKRGDLPDNATVITIDDGWLGTHAHAVPVLCEHGFAATVYVTTYYVTHRQPVFNILLQYILWRSEVSSLDIGLLGPGLEGRYRLDDQVERDEMEDRLNSYATHELAADDRPGFALKLAGLLGVNIADALDRGAMSMMSVEQIRALATAGIDIQLHTHRHRFFQDDRAVVEADIADNRAVLEPLCGRPLTHFCYPSGAYARHQIEWLVGMGVRSAATTKAGLNYISTSPYELTRFCDGESVHPLEFEAELNGVNDLLRNARRRFHPNRK